jgi:hypothetical protein
MKLVEAQLLGNLAWVLRDHALITSGAYKLRDIRVGVEGGGERPCTDEEKLREAMAILGAHCKWVQECVDYIGDRSGDHSSTPEPEEGQ